MVSSSFNVGDVPLYLSQVHTLSDSIDNMMNDSLVILGYNRHCINAARLAYQICMLGWITVLNQPIRLVC